MAIHFTDVYKIKVCEIMNLFIQYKLPGAKYCGVISSRGPPGKPRAIWIWKKEFVSDSTKVKSAYFSARRFYTKVFELIEKRFSSPTLPIIQNKNIIIRKDQVITIITNDQTRNEETNNTLAG